MRYNRRVFAVPLLAIVMCGFYACSPPPRANAPEFSLQNVRGGTLKSGDLKGKIVLVDFWATWCGPCIQEIPRYKKLRENLAGKGVEFLGITMDSMPIDELRPAVEKLGIPYTTVKGDDNIEEGFGGLVGYPTTFLVDKNWKIYKKYLGSPPNKFAKMEQDITALLEQTQ